ncbi:response regulator transcription factor EsaR [Paraburkholderia bonniea]|uniref:response regulator transcription factor EsaR n=1 Tax=Paraburkholderia bonniea TaxID=2152891 RepID=UPI001290DB61|nr:response regulator transcription factor EsaR [Paraburkholderia bonniea]WJF90140.1 response regulator transcription factor EsaR [Paraburkholderia bonniea]WJF93454.1 response regulator transcription factor EsaR [Paraburkholderia bonniea]
MATILVVDDEMGIRELLSEILSDEGHVVEAAENAQEARNFRVRQEPDLVLLDIWMPDTDGVTLLKEWAAQGLLTMPVIMMSGHATIDTAVEATRIGALNFLEKPIALQKLLKAVELGLNRQGAPAPIPEPEAPAPAPPPVNPALVPSAAVLPQLVSTDGAPGRISPDQTTAIPFDIPLRDARDAFERAYFEYHLARENGSMTRVAEKTGLERTHLYRKLKQLGVNLAISRPVKNVDAAKSE